METLGESFTELKRWKTRSGLEGLVVRHMMMSLGWINGYILVPEVEVANYEWQLRMACHDFEREITWSGEITGYEGRWIGFDITFNGYFSNNAEPPLDQVAELVENLGRRIARIESPLKVNWHKEGF